MNDELQKEMRDLDEKMERARKARAEDRSYKLSQIKFAGQPIYQPKAKFGRLSCGQWVAVRPVGDEYKEQTYLGILLGEIAIRLVSAPELEPNTLVVGASGHNPAMYVPDIQKVVFGYESWWSPVKSPADLRQITNSDINNVWYVKALRELSEESQA